MIKFIDSCEVRTQELVAQLPNTLRPWSQAQDLGKDRGILVAGPRGVGKTTFLLSQAKKHGNTLYISADHPSFNIYSLYELGTHIFERGYRTLIIDEVHFAKNWSQHVKALYDDFPNKQLWVSDSSSIMMRQGTYDLSRRMPRLHMPILSFREYLIVKFGYNLGVFNPLKDEAPDEVWDSFDREMLRGQFKSYLIHGTRPFFLEGRYVEKTLGIIEKTIFSDVPFFLENSQSSHLSLMHAVLSYLSATPIPTLNIDSLSREWAIGKPKIYELLLVMVHLELIHIVRKKTDHTSGKGAKIFLADPTWYEVLGGNKGSQREAFVCAMFLNAQLSLFATDKDVEADFVTPYGTVEVGGAKKKQKKARFVLRDDILQITPDSGIPLWMIGGIY